MRALVPEQAEAPGDLRDLWSDRPFVLIGASALALQTDLLWRQTHDLDVVVSMPLEDYPMALDALTGWRRHREGEHAWVARSGARVDVVPVDARPLAVRSLTWPESGARMSLVGMRLAFEHAIVLPVADGLSIAVAPSAALVVLKMVAFLDRPAEREDDLADIAQMLDHYLDPLHERRWQLPAVFDDASAFALGVDIGVWVDGPERQAVECFLGHAKDENDPLRAHARLVRRGPPHWRRHPERLLERVAAFERGLAYARRD